MEGLSFGIAARMQIVAIVPTAKCVSYYRSSIEPLLSQPLCL